MDNLIATVISYMLTAALGTMFAAVKHLWKRQKASESGILALLHDRIYSTYAECNKKGYATVEEIRNLEYLYKPYHDLGGNGTGTELFNRVKKMPDKPAA